MSASPRDATPAARASTESIRDGALQPVATMPLLHLRHFLAQRSALPYPFGEAGVSTWYNARAAIWQGLRALGIGPGARIIAPAYTCGSELDTLVQAGLHLDFYRIGPGLDANLDDLRRLCRTPATAIFATHYYGLPQPIAAIAAIAREHGLMLIEDAAHGLYSATIDGQPLGSFGDMAVFSVWKTLPLPDGGVLRLRPERVKSPLPGFGETPGLASTAGRLRHILEESLSVNHPRAVGALRQHITNPLVGWLGNRLQTGAGVGRSPLGGGDAMPPEAAQIAFRPERRSWRMTTLSSYLLPRVSDAGLADERRMHFRMLEERLERGSAVTPLLSALPSGCCPLFFPVIARDPRPFCRHLAANGVGFFRGWCVFHPHVDWGHFALESHLKEHVVVLPVHQGLTDGDIDHIAHAVNIWNATQ